MVADTAAIAGTRRYHNGDLFPRAEVLELYRVLDLSVEQPLLQGLLGSGRVILTTRDSSTPRIVLEAVPDPLAVADLIRDRVELCRVAKGVREFSCRDRAHRSRDHRSVV